MESYTHSGSSGHKKTITADDIRWMTKHPVSYFLLTLQAGKWHHEVVRGQAGCQGFFGSRPFTSFEVYCVYDQDWPGVRQPAGKSLHLVLYAMNTEKLRSACSAFLEGHQ